MNGNIVDRRGTSNRSAGNRKAFIDRYKDVLKEHVERIAKKRKLTNIADKRDITIDRKTLDEPSYQFDRDEGPWDRVLPGNKKMVNGDRIPIPPKGGKGQGSGGSGEEGVDEFTFTLTKEEFYDILFSGLELPDFIKNGLKTTEFSHMQRSGYTKEGSPCQLDLKKTFENAIARRIATRTEDKEPAYLDEIDLRYKHFAEVTKPSRQAVMFCVLDVSGSMTEDLKSWAKKYFLLLYLFLEKTYTNVELVFIRHTDIAKEVSENDFFTARDTGGTMLSAPLRLTADIIADRYSSDDINIYIAQCSDGENYPSDDELAHKILTAEILPKCQYVTYLEVSSPNRRFQSTWYHYLMENVVGHYKNIKASRCQTEKGIFNVFRDLFKRK